MIHYNIWFGFRDGVDESEGLSVIHSFLNELYETGGVAGFQLLRNSGDAAKTNMLPFQALIEFRDDAQFSAAFAAQAAAGIHSGAHGRVMSLVSDFRIEVFRQIAASHPPIGSSNAPESVVQRQLDAYNARDIDAFMMTYAEDAQQFEYPATLLASGASQLRERVAVRFREPDLHARLIRRIVIGQVVIDHEEVTRTFPEGVGKIELVAIYEVRSGRIAFARFITGRKTLDSRL